MAQVTFNFEQQVPVIIDGDTLDLPWAGGMNAAVYNSMDLDGDGQEDLIVYDRTSTQVIPFLNKDGSHMVAHEYATLFPEIRNWMLLKDFDQDGRKDLFTGSGGQGIKIYKNVTQDGETIAWKLIADPLTTVGFSGSTVALQVGPGDTPGLVDTDQDGDMDILVYNINGDGRLNYYINNSIEEFGVADSLTFIATERRWGGVQECGCDRFVFGSETCEDIYGARTVIIEKEQHVGGKSILPIDIDHDGDIDLITGHEDCSTLYFMENEGDQFSPKFTSFTNMVPDNTLPVAFFVYPAAFYEDVDFDGVKDLIVGPNASYNILDQIDFQESNWMYKNEGTTDNPDFAFSSKSFLQSEMIDVGENATPVLVDLDQDGDLDLLVGNRGLLHDDGFYGSVHHFENIGSVSNPIFEQVTDDFAQLSQLKLQSIKIYFADLDQNGLPEMILTGSTTGYRASKLIVFGNKTEAPYSFNINDIREIDMELNIYDNLAFGDISGNGAIDMLIGTETGSLEYYENQSLGLSPNWTLAQENVAGVSPGIYSLFLSPLLYDLDNDGQSELLSTDISGNILIREGIANKIQQNQETLPDTATLADGPTQGQKLIMGEQNWLTAGKLYGTNEVTVLVGTKGGGISILKLDDLNHTDTDQNELVIYPNPSPTISQRFWLRSSQEIQTVQIISLTGQIMMEKQWSEPSTQLEIDHYLSSGIYLVRAFSVGGAGQSGKIIIY